TRTRLRPVVGRLALFVVFGAVLVSFWALPFVTHTSDHRPVPDSVTRGEAKRWWFNSVDEHEMVKLTASGRLLDDPRRVRSEQVEPLDKRMEQVTMGVTVRSRFPFVTALTGLGLLVALFGFRRAHCRFLAAGLAFSLFLFAGPDDFPLLGRLPLIGLVQTFRCTYLVEFFAYGLVGLGVEAVLRNLWGFVACRRLVVRRVAAAVFAVGLASGISASVAETSLLASLNTRVHPQSKLDTWLDAVSTLPGRGYPFRVLSMERWNSYRAWLASAGFRSPCSHWGAIAPTSSLFLCYQTRGRPQQTEMHALAGIRYIAGSGSAVIEYRDAKDTDGVLLYQRLSNGPDRHGRSNRGRYLLDMGQESFLRPVRGWPLPVICDDRQWLWLVHGWMERYRNRLGSGSTPFPMRVDRGQLGASGLLGEAQAVAYLDRSGPEPDAAALGSFVADGGVVVAPWEIDGIAVRRASADRQIWSFLPLAPSRKGSDGVEIESYDDPVRSSQRYTFDVDVLEPSVIVLPTAAVSGWNAQLGDQPLKIFATGPDMVGALLPAGAHRLKLTWKMPGWQTALLTTSVVALVIALLALVLGLVGRVMLRRAVIRTLRSSGGRK
ncbi:MAG: hypothetical protein JRF63_05540, partial [Deltaproteobacteria bacterium]|nr:hypothetical protein [Deltaproteobacteria bacterium]